MPNLEFKIDTATISDVYQHLHEVDKAFEPALSETININAYAEKIFNYAAKIEAWCNGKLVGLVAIYVNSPPIGFITHVAVSPHYTGLGIADKLMQKTSKLSVSSNISTIQLEVIRNNVKAISLYTKHGFSIEKSEFDKHTLRCDIER